MKNRNEIDNYLGETIKAARLEKGMSLADVASKCNLTGRSTIHRYENGTRSMSIEALLKVCDAVDLDFVKVCKEIKKNYKSLV